MKDDDDEEELLREVERPLEQEATEKPTFPQRTYEEQQEKLQVLREQKQLQEF